MRAVAVFAVLLVTVVAVGVVNARVVSGQAESACVTGGAVPSGNAGLVADCENLLAMKTALRGSSKLNWWSGRSIEKWDGVKVQGGRVAELSLPNRKLNGVLPVGLGSLSALKTLDLSGNSLTGTMPASLNSLTALTKWRFAGNSFSGCVPYGFAQVSDNDAASLNLSTCAGATPTASPIPTSQPTATPVSSQPTPDPSDDRFTAIEDRVGDLERRLAAIEAILARLGGTPTATPTATPVQTNTPTPLPTATPKRSLTDFHNTTNTRWLSRAYPALARQILAFSWAQDGLSPSEKEIIDNLLYLGVYDIEQLKRVVEMPFLLSLDAHDFLAVSSMTKLASEGLMTEVLDHPQVVSSPEDTWAILIVAAGSLFETTPDKIDRLLEAAWIEEGVVHTGYTPQLQVSIVRTGESKPGTLEMAFEAARVVEGTMEMPLPVSHIVVVLDDAAVRDGFAGTNHGHAISYRPEYENPSDSWKWSQFQNGLLHEVSHYFWAGGVAWIDEGMATIHEHIYNLNQGLSPGQLKPRRNKCEAHDLDMLTQWNPEKSNHQFLCNYYMGEVLFLDLLNELGDGDFRDKMRELYALYSSERAAGGKAGIEQIRQVFYDQLDIVEHRWSGKWNAPENRDLTEGIERNSHHLVRWDEYPTFDSASRVVSFKGTLLHDAVLVAPHISIARSGGSQNFLLFPFDGTGYAGWVLPHLEGGRTWGSSERIEAITTTYELDGRSFHIKFPLPEGMEVPTDYVVVVRGFQNGERTPTIGWNVDNLGYARIR